jgi:trehalose utilization protein
MGKAAEKHPAMPEEPPQSPVSDLIRVLVWSEGSEPRDVYGDGIRDAIADYLRQTQPDMVVRTESANHPGGGVSADDLDNADVLVWWAHVCHNEVSDEAADRIARRVTDGGMGFVALHSANRSKPLQRILSASGAIAGTVLDAGPEQVRTLLPDHPIARNVPPVFTLPREESWREPFDLPPPDVRVFESHFPDQNESATFALGGACWTRGRGRVFFFRPGHETYPTYFDPNVRQVIANACRWAAQRT